MVVVVRLAVALFAALAIEWAFLPEARGSEEACGASTFDAVIAGIRASHTVPVRNISDARDRIVYLNRTMDQIDVTKRILLVCNRIALTAKQIENASALSEALDRLKYATYGEVGPAFIAMSRSMSDTACSVYAKDIGLTYLQASKGAVSSTVMVPDNPVVRSMIQLGMDLMMEAAIKSGVDLDGPPPSPPIRVQGMTITPRCEALINTEIPRRLHYYGLR